MKSIFFKTFILILLVRTTWAQIENTTINANSSTSETNRRWYFLVSSGLGKSAKDSNSSGLYDEQKRLGGSSEYIASFDAPSASYSFN